ncbi:MAG TPA: MFS transporter [Firmicutes bacterium]|nr:MFS transporter [Bacillota bacterium]
MEERRTALKKKTALQFAVLCGVPFVMVLGNSMLIPVFPQMKQAMGLTQFQVGLIVTFFSVPAGILIPLAGFLSDRYGRKPIMVPALFIYGLGGLICGFAALFLENPYGILLAGRVIQGAGAGGTYQLAMALTGDTFQSNERTKVLGLLEAANGLGKVLSPILGSLIALVSWYTPFFAYGILAFPIGLGVWLLVPEKQGNPNPDKFRQYWKKLKDVFQEKGTLLLASYLVGMVALFLLFGVLSYVSDILESTYNVFGLKKGFVLAIPVFSMALTSYLSGIFLSDKQALWKPAIVGGMFATAITMALLPLFTNLIPYIVVLFFAGISIGVLLPPINSLITGATTSDRRGTITCLYGTVRFLGVAIGPPTFGLAIEFGKWPMFLGCAAIAAITAIIAFLSITPPRQSE